MPRLSVEACKLREQARQTMDEVRLLWLECFVTLETMREQQQAFEIARTKATALLDPALFPRSAEALRRPASAGPSPGMSK